MTLTMDRSFAHTADLLPKEARAKLPKFFCEFITNPRHPSLHFEKITGAARRDIYKCRLDQYWRIIVKEIRRGSTYTLVCVGRHDEAIELGRKLK